MNTNLVEETEELNNICYVRISNGRKPIYNSRFELAENGFEFNKRSNNNSFYEKKMTEDEAAGWEKWGKIKKLRIDVIPEQYMRSTDYRKTFFSSNEPAVPAYYRCAYCGKKILYKDTTVDHIFPINQLCYSEKVRRQAARHGISGANDEYNLVAACRRCNSRKGTKMGFWIIRGFLGKSEFLWRIRKGLRYTVAVIVIAYMAGAFLYGSGIVNANISAFLH